jgi:ferrous iron transport protein A
LPFWTNSPHQFNFWGGNGGTIPTLPDNENRVSARIDNEIENHYHLVPMDRTLADLSPNQAGRIRSILGADGLSQRLAEMGFTLGQMVRVVRFAPLGDPMQIHIRGFNLALRRNEARRIVLDPL